MRFIKNTWYIAMWANGLPLAEPQHRTILGEPIVLYRTQTGELVALQDRCPHRLAPLSLGSICQDGNIRCGYHGLEFDSTGACVKNPHGKGAIPKAAVVKSYPVVERYGLIWVWMGNQPPDESKLPDLSALDTANQDLVTYRDMLRMEANYELVISNLLDLSHAPYLHKGGVLGGADSIPAEVSVTQEGDTVTVARLMRNVKPPVLLDMLYKRNGELVDSRNAITWIAPCYLLNNTSITTSNEAVENGSGIIGMHLLTPETERTTIYHFVAVRTNPRPFPDHVRHDIMQRLRDMRRYAFEQEDLPMIEAQQKMMDLDPEAQPVYLEVDGGTVRYRRILDALTSAEAALV